jgi:hypothetical protein
MRGEPSIEEWEQTLDADLLHHLIPAGQLPGMRRPLNVNELSAGAQMALADGIGRHGLEDLLIVPPAERTYGWQRRRRIYAPPCVLGLGERAVALWVQALPAPGIRILVPLSEIAAIAWQASGMRRQLHVTGRAGRLSVRYNAASDTFMEAWTRRLRTRTAGDPEPVPADYPGIRDVTHGRRRAFTPAALRLDSDDDVAISGQPGRPGRRACLLAATPRELVILRSAPSANPFGRRADSLYVPRRAIEDADVRSGSLVLRSAGVDLRVGLRSRKAVAAASAWLGQVLNDHDHDHDRRRRLHES